MASPNPSGTVKQFRNQTMLVKALTVDGQAFSPTDAGYIDGVTPGTAAASKALVVNASKNISSLGAVSATSFTGALTGNVTGNVTGLFRMTINPDVAAAGSTVTDAAQLLEGFQVVTGANGTKGVKLPATPAAGMIVWIKGTTAGVLKVWPDAAATINAISSNGALSLTTGVMPSIFIAYSATQWYSFPLVAS